MRSIAHGFRWLLTVLLLTFLFACDSGGGGGGGGNNSPKPPPVVNHPPVITSTPIITATAEELYEDIVTAIDADNDTLIYSLLNYPAGMTIDSATGKISWIPAISQAGIHSIKVKVSDGKTFVTVEYNLTVIVVPNTAPQITSVPIRGAIVSHAYPYVVIATDAQNDTLTYGLLQFPAGMTINSASGQITWTPGAVGNYSVEISVTDGDSISTQKFAVRVIPADNGVPFQSGCTLTGWWYTDYEMLTSHYTVDKMKAAGCTCISVLVTQYQDNINSTTIAPIFSKTNSDAGLVQIISYIHSQGLIVMLKPHVDVQSTAWRGEITFTAESDWTAWFASYTTFINHYLDLAEANGVEIFCLGTEFKATEHRETQWRAQIANGRTKFSGLITYAANWDSYNTIAWWDALDFIGIDAYFPLTGTTTPTQAQLNAAWIAIKNNLATFAVAKGMDIVFTEFGYQSINGTNMYPPWVSGSVDLQEQADCYEALFSVNYNEPWFKGGYNWMWYWDPSQDVNKFDIYGKPAELVLRSYYLGY